MSRRVLALAVLAAWTGIVAGLSGSVGMMITFDRLAPVSGALFVCEAFGSSPQDRRAP